MALAIPIITEFDGKGISSAIKEFKNLETASDKIAFAAKEGAKVAALGFAALAAAGAVAAGVLVKAAQAAAEDQAAQVRLASQIKATSDATDLQIKGVEKYIDQTQRAVGVADDKLRPAFGRLIAATKDVKTAQDLLNISLDIAAATGKDVEAVAGALAKAQEGNFTAVDRLGIGYEKGEAKARGFLGVQKDLEERFGGAAATRAQTYEGIMDRLRITLGELQESIGYKVLPILSRLTDAALAISDAFGRDGAAGGIAELQTQLLNMSTGSDGMINTFGKIYNSIVGFVNGVQAALAIPMAAIHFLRTGDLGNYTVKKIPSFAEMMASQNARPGFTSAREFESQMNRGTSASGSLGGGGGGGGGAGGTGGGGGVSRGATPGKIVGSVPETVFMDMGQGLASDFSQMGIGGIQGLNGATINIDAGLISSPASIGQDIIAAILAAQRDSGVVFAPASGL